MPVKRPAIGFIFITLLLDVTGWGIIIPVMPNLVRELLGDGSNGLSSVSAAATYGGWFDCIVFHHSIFFCAPIVGGLSDRFGRRPVLLGSLLGFGVDFLFKDLLLLSVGCLWEGYCWSDGCKLQHSWSIHADISTPEKQSTKFGEGRSVQLLVSVFIVGPVIGGCWAALVHVCPSLLLRALPF